MINFNSQYQQLFNETANSSTTESSNNIVSKNVHLKKEYFENRLRLQYIHKSEIDITKNNLLAERQKCGAGKHIFIVPKQEVKERRNHHKMRRHSSVELYTSDIPVFPAVVQSYRYQSTSNDNSGEESNC